MKIIKYGSDRLLTRLTRS